MFPRSFSNSSLSEEASISSCTTRIRDFNNLNSIIHISPQEQQQPKKKRNLPGNPEPNAEVIALSPRTLLTSNRFVCEVCNKGFQRDQNLQLHRRGHNLPWKLHKRNNAEYRKKVYVCPEPSCVHHNPARALGDLTGIKKHFCRKHREKKLRCQKCSKMYAVESDYKAHSKICGTREIICGCGRVFSRKDKYEIHKPFCDALAKEAGRVHSTSSDFQSFQQNQPTSSPNFFFSNQDHDHDHDPKLNSPNEQQISSMDLSILHENTLQSLPLPLSLPLPAQQQQQQQQQLAFLGQVNMMQNTTTAAYISPAATILRDAANTERQSLGLMSASTTSNQFDMKCYAPLNQVSNQQNDYMGFSSDRLTACKNTDCLTKDFLGLAGEVSRDGGSRVSNRDFLSFTGGIYFGTYGRDQLMLRTPRFGYRDSWVGDH